MGRKTFKQYTKLAEEGLSPYVVSGRYNAHAINEPAMIKDIMKKLDLCPEDNLLEIGCGPGNIIIPLSFFVNHATGIDNQSVIKILSKRVRDHKITGIACNFLDYKPKPNESYEKILINSVIAALSDRAEALEFVRRAASLLTPGGSLLLSDIANIDKRDRFISTNFGRDFDLEWKASVKQKNNFKEENLASYILKQDANMFIPDDEFVFTTLRSFRCDGWEAFVLPQPTNLPFGHTREDILIKRLAL